MTAENFGLSAMLAILFLGAMAMLRAQVTRPGDTMQLWEYHTEIVREPGARHVGARSRIRAADQGRPTRC